MTTLQQTNPRVIASYVGPRSLEPRSRIALGSLGYKVVAAATRGTFDDPDTDPDTDPDAGGSVDLRLTDERHIEKLPEPSRDSTPIVVLCGSRPISNGPAAEDPRIVARVTRPARLRELYRAFQNALERSPRRAPRIQTELAARGICGDRRFVGAVRSLSECGCLFQGAHDLRNGDPFSLQIAIPSEGVVTTRGTCVNARKGEIGVDFASQSESTRDCIAHFILHRLSSHLQDSSEPSAA